MKQHSYFKHDRSKQMKQVFVIAATALLVGISQPALAAGEHMHGDHHDAAMMAEHGHMHGEMKGQMPSSMDMDKQQMFLERKTIDGYDTSFHIMKAPADMQNGGNTYHFMFKAEKGGQVLTDLTVNSKVTHPDGRSESKMMMKMGDWYMAGYDLSHEGRHQLMVLFKTRDGNKHFGGIFFPPKGKE